MKRANENSRSLLTNCQVFSFYKLISINFFVWYFCSNDIKIFDYFTRCSLLPWLHPKGVTVCGQKGKAVIQRSGATDIRRITSRWRVSVVCRSYFRFCIDSNMERILINFFIMTFLRNEFDVCQLIGT